ncbi:MAG: small multi-drug export protein [Euryarchaeota archaeon]|nr:small multi-drug export protein [Euryarchaeota archaeon]
MARTRTRVGLTGWRLGIVGVVLALLLAGVALVIGGDVLGALSEFGSEDAAELIAGADGTLQYGLVFLLAAIPLLEILVVIPIGVGLGLNAFGVALFAFLGNVLPIYGIIVFYGRLKTWWESRREGEAPARRERAKRIWNQYGLPGLALVSPVLTGVHLAATLALAFGSEKRAVALWMTVAIALWTVVLTVGSYYGFGYLSALV